MVKDQEASLLEASQFTLHCRENVNEGGETRGGWHDAGASRELCYSQPMSAGDFWIIPFEARWTKFPRLRERQQSDLHRGTWLVPHACRREPGLLPQEKGCHCPRALTSVPSCGMSHIPSPNYAPGHRTKKQWGVWSEMPVSCLLPEPQWEDLVFYGLLTLGNLFVAYSFLLIYSCSDCLHSQPSQPDPNQMRNVETIEAPRSHQ